MKTFKMTTTRAPRKLETRIIIASSIIQISLSIEGKSSFDYNNVNIRLHTLLHLNHKLWVNPTVVSQFQKRTGILDKEELRVDRKTCVRGAALVLRTTGHLLHSGTGDELLRRYYKSWSGLAD